MVGSCGEDAAVDDAQGVELVPVAVHLEDLQELQGGDVPAVEVDSDPDSHCFRGRVEVALVFEAVGHAVVGNGVES